MNDLQLFLPCAAGVEDFLATEVQAITGVPDEALRKGRGGVGVRASWHDALKLNLHSRLSQRVLVQLAHRPYRDEQDIYDAASGVAWELWFTAKQSFKIELTAQHSPLQSLNFATLRIKDAVADRFRAKGGVRPDVDTQWPDARIHAHLTREQVTLYIDTSGEPLFKRGWREDKGEAPLKETLAAAMLAASGWGGVWNPGAAPLPLYDPCCGSGTIAIEAAQIACRMAPGRQRRFGFERLLPFQPAAWQRIKAEAEAAITPLAEPLVFGSDVAHRMVDFAQRNAERAGVASAIEFRGGDALQRMPPSTRPGVLLLNPPYNERIAVAGIARGERNGAGDGAGTGMRAARETAQTEDGGEFFSRLATHWKKNYAGWTAWVLTPDLKLPGRMRLKETRRVPLWNGPIECRLFRFDMVVGKMETPSHAPSP
jgi:putative N6-adenine-specific DNA methylase